MNVGDTIKFGPFEWIVLEVDEERALILTKDIIEVRDYHSKYVDITWEMSAIREYLNSTFKDRFSIKEWDQIVETINLNTDNPWYGSKGGNSTIDRVFLLSLEEVVRLYFGDSSKILNNPQRYWFQSKDVNNVLRRALYLDLPWWWWTRTPGKSNRTAVYIHGDGNVGIQGNGVGRRSVNVIHPVNNETQGGVRPAMRIRTEKEETK